MRYWFDTEFVEDGKTIDLVSIGIVAEDNRTYYAVSKDFNAVKLFDNPWLVDNVVPGLGYLEVYDKATGKMRPPRTWAEAERPSQAREWKHRNEIAKDVVEFFFPDGDIGNKPEIWAYYANYDWVALCQLFGKMIDLPPGMPMYCRDLKQLSDLFGVPKFPKGKDEHNALADAQWNRNLHRHIWDYTQGYFPIAYNFTVVGERP